MTSLTFALHGPIVIELPCRTSKESRSGTVHEVVLNPDWSVTTPHDDAAEAIAVAFGGWSSCHELSTAVRATRFHIDVNLRREWYPLDHRQAALWVGDTEHSFRDVYTAASFVRSAWYAARRYRVSSWQVGLLAQATRWWASDDRPDVDDFDRHRSQLSCGGVEKLWEAGIHPDSISRIRRWAEAGSARLTAEHMIDLAYTSLKTEDIRRLTEARGSVAAVAEWLGGGETLPRRWLQETR